MKSKAPDGNHYPEMTFHEISQYKRDAKVKAWVLLQAGGKCENCGQFAPFITHDDMPYLEVHHIRRLSDKGSDTITNIVALCPNCHRELHYGKKSKEILEKLYISIKRLKIE